MMYGVPKTTSESGNRLARAITWAASKQTYAIVRFLVDRDRVNGAYRAYSYFRWVDDRLDEGGLDASERAAFVARQEELVARCYRGDWPEGLLPEERLLADLIRSDPEPGGGLHAYIHHMMAVMAFDAERRGRLITEPELADYTRRLATAVTEALHYFIGHDSSSPQNALRYLAATGAHVTHMLRDMLEDIEAGYVNIPREVIESGGVSPLELRSGAYRAWVMQRVGFARECFRAGHKYLGEVENGRCRLAGYAYTARFESVLDAIERDDYRLSAAYPECKTLHAGLSVGQSVVSQMTNQRRAVILARPISPAQR